MVRGLPADVAWRLSRPGAERRAVRGGAAWSPDGERIAFTWQEGDGVRAVGRGGGAMALVAYRSYIGVAVAAVAAVLMVVLIVAVSLAGSTQ